MAYTLPRYMRRYDTLTQTPTPTVAQGGHSNPVVPNVPRQWHWYNAETRRSLSSNLGPHAVAYANKKLASGDWKAAPNLNNPPTCPRGKKSQFKKIGYLVAFIRCPNCCLGEENPASGYGGVIMLHDDLQIGHEGHKLYCSICGVHFSKIEKTTFEVTSNDKTWIVTLPAVPRVSKKPKYITAEKEHRDALAHDTEQYLAKKEKEMRF